MGVPKSSTAESSASSVVFGVRNISGESGVFCDICLQCWMIFSFNEFVSNLFLYNLSRWPCWWLQILSEYAFWNVPRAYLSTEAANSCCLNKQSIFVWIQNAENADVNMNDFFMQVQLITTFDCYILFDCNFHYFVVNLSAHWMIITLLLRKIRWKTGKLNMFKTSRFSKKSIWNFFKHDIFLKICFNSMIENWKLKERFAFGFRKFPQENAQILLPVTHRQRWRWTTGRSITFERDIVSSWNFTHEFYLSLRIFWVYWCFLKVPGIFFHFLHFPFIKATNLFL